MGVAQIHAHIINAIDMRDAQIILHLLIIRVPVLLAILEIHVIHTGEHQMVEEEMLDVTTIKLFILKI